MHKISIILGNGLVLSAEKCFDPEYNEICIWLEDEDGKFVQDIANIGQEYSYNKDGDVVPKNSFRVRVWADPNNEDITDSICEIKLNEYGKEVIGERNEKAD